MRTMGAMRAIASTSEAAVQTLLAEGESQVRLGAQSPIDDGECKGN